MSCDLRDKFSFCVRDDPDGPFVRVPAFFNSQGLRIVAYTAPSINHTPRRGAALSPLQMHPLTKDEARRLAEQIVRLPELVRIAKGIEPGEA